MGRGGRDQLQTIHWVKPLFQVGGGHTDRARATGPLSSVRWPRRAGPAGGHIGYSIRPSQRRKGYARETLRLTLDKCREAGEARVLITCDKDNIPSARTIPANGGVLENEVVDEPGLGQSGMIQRYWITLTKS